MSRRWAARLFSGPLLQLATRFVEQVSSVPLLVVLTLLSILFPVVVFPVHGIGDIRPLDLHFFYSPDQVYAHLAMLGADGRNAYVSMALTSDLLFPVIYAMALTVALVLVLRELLPAASRLRYLPLFPVLIVFADWCENLGLAAVTHTFPGRADGIVRVASAFTSLKWLFIAISVLMLFTAVICRVVRAVRGRRQR